MKGKKLRGSILTLMIVALLLAGGCKNPFQSGLGDKVDIGRPIVTLDAPDPGEFLRGEATFTGRASDDLSVSAVRISFDRGVTWIDVDTYDPNTTEWSHTINTRETDENGFPRFPNGRLNVRVRVIDDSDKQTTTEELLFTVDNESPSMFILVPSIDPETYDPGSPPVVAANGVIVGTVTDRQGIAEGHPQIKFWPAGDDEPEEWTSLRPGATDTPAVFDFQYRLRAEYENEVGSFQFRLRAMDVAGQVTDLPAEGSLPFQVKVVSGDAPPVLSGFQFVSGDVLAVGGNSYARTDFSFHVDAVDTNGVQLLRLERRRDGGPWEPIVWADDDEGVPTRRATSPAFTASPDGSNDGTYEFHIQAISVQGLEAFLTRVVVVDTTPPDIEITNLRPTVMDDSGPGDPIERVNGTVELNVAAGDANGLSTVKWWLLPAGSPPDNLEDGGDAFLSTPYAVQIDSTTLPDDQYTLFIGARDRAGNERIVARNITVDQSSDIPAVSFIDLDAAVSTSDAAGVGGLNLLDANARIRGVVEDDDRVDPARIEISLNGGAWQQVQTVGFAGRSVSFAHPVDALGEGTHSFSFRFADDPSAKLGDTPPVATGEVGPIYFLIDLAPPSLTVTSPGAGSFQGAPFSFTGTAFDPNGLQTHDFGGALGERGYVEIETPSDPGEWVRFPVDGDTGLWSAELGSVLVGDGLFAGSFEGQRTVQVRARDRFGKQSTIGFSFTVDTVAPEVAVTAPASADWLSGASGSVQGTATDTDSTVTEVRVWVGPEIDDPPVDVSGWALATGTTSWNVPLNLSALGEGSQRAHVQARDAAGNWSSSVTRDFGIDQVSPALTETSIGGPTGARNNAFSLGGTMSDTNALASLLVTQRRGTGDAVEVYRNDLVTGTSQPWAVTALPRDPNAADPTDPATVDVSDGVYIYEITVTDVAGKTTVLTREVRVDLVGPQVAIAAPSDGAAVQGTALLITGTAADVESVSAVTETRYWIGPVTPSPPADYGDWSLATGTGNWNATLSFGLGEEGAKRLHVVARDAAGNWSADVATVAFALDQAPPTLSGFSFTDGTINTVGGNNYARDGFGFSFTAADSNELAEVRVMRNATEVFSHVYSSGETSAVVTLDQEVGGTGLGNGIYEYVITVTDVVGKSAQLSRTVIVDVTSPVVEFNSLAPLVTNGATDYVNSTVRFILSATDDNGITDVRWWILPQADVPPQFDDAGGVSFGSAPYVALLNTVLLTDMVSYRLHVIAADRAGNETRIERTFTVNQSTDVPVVTITSPSADSFVDGGHIVRGSISDDDAVDTASIEARYHNGVAWSDWAPATSVTGSGREVTFTYTLPSGTGADGPKRVQARASDLASAKFGGDPAAMGQSSEVEFTLDSVAPVVTVSAPGANATRRETFTVTGSVVEANLESLRVSLSGASPVDATVSGSEETKSWEYALPSPTFDALDQGPTTITVTAIDRVGRSQTVQRVVFKDTSGPAIVFSSIVSGENTIITESTPTVRGSFADEFSNVAATFEYRLNAQDELDPWTSTDVTGSGKSVAWSVPVSALSDGSHRIDLRVEDEIGNQTIIEGIAFRIDREAPVVTISEPPSGSIYGGVEFGTVFTLSGTSTDANLLSVNVAVNAGGQTDVTGTIINGESTWGFPLAQGDFVLLPEGANSVTVTAVDAAGRVTVREWEFTKDTEAPVITVSNLETDGSTVLLEGSPRVQGTTTDDYGVSRVETRIERLPIGSATWESYNGSTTTWVADAPTVDDEEFWTDRTITVDQTVVTWTKQLGSHGLNLPDGLYRVRVRAYDRATPDSNLRTLDAVEFRIDRANPILTLNATSGFQRQDFTLSGTAADLNGVASVRAKVGDGDFTAGTIADASTSDAYATWSLTVPTSGLAQGSHTVFVQATDGAGRTITLTRAFTFDGVAPTVSVNEPISGTRVNGRVVVRGTSDDDNAVASVRYRFGNGAEVWQTAGLGGGLYSWSYTFNNINTFANTAAVTEVDPTTGDPQSGTNVWALPFQVQVRDVAGNITEELAYRLFVDPDMDAPQVTVISPANDQIVGGSVRVSGFSSDDDWVRRVEMRVDPTGTGGSFGPWEAVTLVNRGTQVNWFSNINSDGGLNPPAGEIRDVRIQVRAWDSKDFGITDGIVGDTTEINIKFDSGVPVIENIEIVRGGVSEPYVAGVRAAGVFTVRATIRDEGGIASIRKRGEEDAAFVDVLGNSAITTTPAERSAGSFEVDRKYLITSLGNTDFTTIGATSNTIGISFRATGQGAGTGTAFEATGLIDNPAAQFFVYEVELEIDSTTVNSSKYAGTSGFYSLAIQATDNATPTPYLTQESLNIQIDNFFPLAEYTSSPNAAGTDYFIQGRAWDVATGSGSIQGIDRVVVYFQRGANYINLNGGVFDSAPRLMRNAGTPGSEDGAPFETLDFPATDGIDGIAINTNEVTTDLDGSGYIEGWTDDGVFKNWYARFNTTQLADGPVTLNYVVIDRAGNATRYVQPLYIRNNAPRIDAVLLGTDVNADGLIGDEASGESRLITTNYDTTNFTVRSNRLRFTVEASSGNAPRRYSVGYVTSTAEIGAAALTPGSVYTISTPGDTNWTQAGAPNNSVGTTFVATTPGTGSGLATGYTTAEQNGGDLTGNVVTITDFSGIPDTAVANGARFVIKVYDSTVDGGTEADQLADAAVIGLNIDNIDTVVPVVRVAPFGRRFSTSASAAEQIPVEVAAYSDNLVTTGSGFSQQRHGYVQYAEHSTWVGSTLDASDVSGKVIFFGRATDNQRIGRITAQIAGFDGGAGTGTEFEIAVWNGGGVSAPADRAVSDVAAGTSEWGFEVVAGSQFITEADGHVLNWRFAWNSAAIDNVAQLGVPIVFRAYDFGPVNGNDADDVITVDVVPYVASIVNPIGQGGLSNDVIRTATGAYSVEQHPTRVFRAEGFNLSGAVAHMSAGPIAIQPATPNLAVSAATMNSVDVSKNFASSGALTLFVNSIPSLNNLNDDTQLYNRETTATDPRSARWTDDRVIQSWTVTSVLPSVNNQTFYYPSMVMADNQPLFSYTNDNNGYTYRTTGDTGSVIRSGAWFERHTALARTATGQNWILSVQDAFDGGGIGYLYLNRDRQQVALLGGNPQANDRHFEITGIDFDSRQLNRFRYPKLHVDGPDNNTNIYITYFDAHPNRRDLTFVSFRATSATASNLAQPANDSSRATQIRVIPNTAGAASEFYDMVKVGTDEIAVVYFDEAAGALRLQYSSDPWDAANLTNTTSTWTEMVIDDSPLTGSHVAMTLGERDGNTFLYIAYHDAANTSLKFAQVDWTTKSVTRVTVDSRFSVGTRANVHAIGGLPYVSYFSDSYAGTRNSLRLAHPIANEGRSAEDNTAMDGVAASGEYTGNWEVAAIPASSVPRGGIEQFNRTQINEYTQDGETLPVVGWLADRLEYARFRPVVRE